MSRNGFSGQFHSITFQFEVQDPFEITTVSSLMKSTSGNFNVRRTIKWKGEAHIPSEKTTKSVRDATLADNSGSIPLSIQGEHITAVEEEKFYTFTECKLCTFMGSTSQLLNQPVCSRKTRFDQS